MTTAPFITVAAAAALIVGATAAPAGSHSPLVLRTVTIGEHTGPAYYSPIEGRYRFVERAAEIRLARLTK